MVITWAGFIPRNKHDGFGFNIFGAITWLERRSPEEMANGDKTIVGMFRRLGNERNGHVYEHITSVVSSGWKARLSRWKALLVELTFPVGFEDR